MKETQPETYYSKLKVLAGYTLDKNLSSEPLFEFSKEAHHPGQTNGFLILLFLWQLFAFQSYQMKWWKTTLYGKLIPSSLSSSYNVASL